MFNTMKHLYDNGLSFIVFLQNNTTPSQVFAM